MTTSSFAESEVVPLRNGGYEADSTSSTSGQRSAVAAAAEERKEAAGVVGAEGGRETLPLLLSRSSSSSSSSTSSSSSPSSNSPWRPRSSTEVYTCHLCSFVGVTRESFDQHMVDCHYIYRCMECSYSARTQGRLKRHLKDTHHKSATIAGHRDGPGRPNPMPRPIIGDQELKMNRRLKTIRCKYCKFITVEKTDFWLHLSEHIPPDKQLRCTKCPFVTDLKHHHEYHQRSHDGFKPFLCQKCGYSCVNKSMLNSHSKSHSNVYRFRCGVCSFAAKYSHALKLHVLKYAHCAGPVLNQDGSLPAVALNVAVQQPPVNPGFHQDGLTVEGRQISVPSREALLQQDERFSSKRGISGSSEQLLLNHVESYSEKVMPARVETRVSCKVPTPTCSQIPFFHQDGETVSVPVTIGLSGGDVIHHNGNRLSMSTNPGLVLTRASNADTSLSFGYANNRIEEPNNYNTGLSSSTAVINHCCTEETRQERESPIEAGKTKLLEGGGPMLDLPFNTCTEAASFPSQKVQPSFQFAPVDLRRPAASAVNLSALLQRQRTVFPSLPYPPEDLGGRSEISRFYPTETNITAAAAAASTPGRPFQITDGYSTSTVLLPTVDQEFGMDYEEEPFSPPGSNGETDHTADLHVGEFILVDETRWDNVESETPLDLSNWKGSTSEMKETLNPTSWDDLHVHVTLPHHQTFTPAATFPSSSSTSPTPYHLGQTVPSFLQQPASHNRPPPLLPLSWTHPRNETRDPDQYQLNDKDEVLTSEDPDHQRNEGHDPYHHPLPDDDDIDDIDSSPPVMKLDWRLEEEESDVLQSFECQHCRMIFDDYVMFAIHSDHHGYVDPFECSMCGEKCEDRIQFFLHISRVAHD